MESIKRKYLEMSRAEKIEFLGWLHDEAEFGSELCEMLEERSMKVIGEDNYHEIRERRLRWSEI